MNIVSRLYFTRQSLLQLKELKINQPDHYYLIKKHQLPILCRYPLQGRLLLNRTFDKNTHEIELMMKQLLINYPDKEIREFFCGSESLLYLWHLSAIYLLAIMPINNAIPGIEQYWANH